MTSNYIEWILHLEVYLQSCSIEYSDYDEFYIQSAVAIAEQIVLEQQLDISQLTNLSSEMIDSYTNNAIKLDPIKKEYYETVSFYLKKRLL